MRITAHRGYAHDNPENTLQAVKDAISHEQTNAVEIDVRRCLTGEIIVIHDETLERVSDNLNKPVSSYTLQELQETTILGSNQNIPTLKEIVEEVPNSIELNIELKETGIAKDVLNLINQYDGTYYIQSFKPECLKEIRKHNQSIEIGLLAWEPTNEITKTATNLNCQRVNPDLNTTTRENVKQLQENGFEVDVWTIRSEKDAEKARRLQPNGIITDSKHYI